jgi:endonuclease/exonuclease/phosphatase family metal-dependent hydrolase
MVLRFATYNIQYGVGQDGCYNLARIIEAVEGLDIICLQEVTTNWRLCNHDNQPHLLSQALNLYGVYAPAYELGASRRGPDGKISNARRGFGNMVLSRWPIVYSRPHALPRPWTEVPPEFHPSVDFPRTALEVVIDIDGRFLRVISVHLSQLPGAQRQAQIVELQRLVQRLPDEALLWEDDPRIQAWSEDLAAPEVPCTTLLSGDFNFEPESAEYTNMSVPLAGEGPALLDAWVASDRRDGNGRSCLETDGRLSRLDYLFVTPDLKGKLRSASVDQAIKASDHFPVTFTIEI